MRTILAILAVALFSATAHAAPLRKTTRPTTCVGGQCAKAVTAPVRVVRKVVGR